MQYVSNEATLAWITEHTDVDRQTAETVLALEHEYMVAVGIASPIDHADTGFEYRFYDPATMERTASIDSLALARDAELLAGVPEDRARAVLDAELSYLEYRGLA